MGWYTPERLDAMIAEAVDRTMILFDARRPPAGEMPVILASGASGGGGGARRRHCVYFPWPPSLRP